MFLNTKKINIEWGYYMKYRITKYNSKLRSDDGKYLIDEWTSFYDFQKKSVKAIPLHLYFDTENAYSNVYMPLSIKN